jgi:hypothetical protein
MHSRGKAEEEIATVDPSAARRALVKMLGFVFRLTAEAATDIFPAPTVLIGAG